MEKGFYLHLHPVYIMGSICAKLRSLFRRRSGSYDVSVDVEVADPNGDERNNEGDDVPDEDDTDWEDIEDQGEEPEHASMYHPSSSDVSQVLFNTSCPIKYSKTLKND